MAFPWCLPVRAGPSPIRARRFAECGCAVDDFRPVCLLTLPLLLLFFLLTRTLPLQATGGLLLRESAQCPEEVS